jgi:hydrogenase 3 maturation protease
MNEGKLKKLNNKNVLFVGIGNVLKQDDGVGVYISNNIKRTQIIKTLTVEVSIENYISKINQINSENLILIDCVDFNKNPGFWDILPVNKINGLITNTHNISLNKISELFNNKAYILGIQPKTIQFGENLTSEIKRTADLLIKKINNLNH